MFGLSVGLAVCLLRGLYVHHEWSYDRNHPHADANIQNGVHEIGTHTVHWTAETVVVAALLPASITIRLSQAHSTTSRAVMLLRNLTRKIRLLLLFRVSSEASRHRLMTTYYRLTR
ncbi:MAG: hypothetical protein HOM68_21135 [Gemmatimonadetes bacterium]|nr:hypothetical protein [Gemmatimonadota bacterium]MBT4612818.1 hypothetical protein [Gemmatimonadota bacterium]MBT5059062.1 hypothetical protein [Gemmatimonadota bacterium]MBT5144734.1 hypothetical protein [Gemmatimonadota bacterium]MBT5589593.1 hypothetical protein [Gemmatimonadota bacterium]